MNSSRKLKMMVKGIQIAIRRAITMISSNKLGVNNRVSVNRFVFVVLITILMLNASAVAQNDSREIISQKVNDILQSVRGPNEPQTAGKAKPVVVSRFSKTKNGYLRFLRPPRGHDFPVSSVVRGDAEATAKNFLTEHKTAFGIRSKALDLITLRTKTRTGHNHVRFQQTYENIPVFASEITGKMR